MIYWALLGSILWVIFFELNHFWGHVWMMVEMFE